MNPKLACADFTFPLVPHHHALDLIAMLGFDGVDIGLFPGRSHLQPGDELNAAPGSAGRLGRQLADRGLKAADVFLQMDPDFTAFAVNHPDPARRARARDWFERTLEYAAGCGCPHVTTLPGVLFDGVPPADCFALDCDELAWRVERARPARVVFGVEAHIGSIAPTPQEARRLIDAVPGLTLTLDYTHFTYLGLPDAEVEPLIALASHFHARGARPGRLQVSFQENVIDYSRVLRVMEATGYGGFIGVEYVWTEWQRCNEVDNLSETILFRDFFKSSGP